MTRGAFDVRWYGVDGVARKLSFEPMCAGHLRIEYEWTGIEWREVGREPVEEVAIETAEGTLEADSR